MSVLKGLQVFWVCRWMVVASGGYLAHEDRPSCGKKGLISAKKERAFEGRGHDLQLRNMLTVGDRYSTCLEQQHGHQEQRKQFMPLHSVSSQPVNFHMISCYVVPLLCFLCLSSCLSHLVNQSCLSCYDLLCHALCIEAIISQVCTHYNLEKHKHIIPTLPRAMSSSQFT